MQPQGWVGNCTDSIRQWLLTQNNKAAKKAGTSRDELLKQVQDSYYRASKSGGSNYASVTSYLAAATDSAKEATFDTWSDSELKSYLDSYGITSYQGSTTQELRAAARRNAYYFRHGASTPPEGIFARVSNGIQWVLSQLRIGAAKGSAEAEYQGQKGADAVKEGVTAATNRASEAAQKEEL